MEKKIQFEQTRATKLMSTSLFHRENVKLSEILLKFHHLFNLEIYKKGKGTKNHAHLMDIVLNEYNKAMDIDSTQNDNSDTLVGIDQLQRDLNAEIDEEISIQTDKVTYEYAISDIIMSDRTTHREIFNHNSRVIKNYFSELNVKQTGPQTGTSVFPSNNSNNNAFAEMEPVSSSLSTNINDGFSSANTTICEFQSNRCLQDNLHQLSAPTLTFPSDDSRNSVYSSRNSLFWHQKSNQQQYINVIGPSVLHSDNVTQNMYTTQSHNIHCDPMSQRPNSNFLNNSFGISNGINQQQSTVTMVPKSPFVAFSDAQKSNMQHNHSNNSRLVICTGCGELPRQCKCNRNQINHYIADARRFNNKCRQHQPRTFQDVNSIHFRYYVDTRKMNSRFSNDPVRHQRCQAYIQQMKFAKN